MELLERVREFARKDPSRAAFVDAGSGAVMTYGELAEIPGKKIEVLRAGNSFCFVRGFIGGVVSASKFLVVSDRVSEGEVGELKVRWERSPLGRGEIGGGGVIGLPTSGSTARPKVVVRSHASLGLMGRALAERVGFGVGEVVLATVPLAHSYGLEHGLLGPLWGGATVVLCGSAERGVMEEAMGWKPTIAPVVPPVVEVLGGVGCGSLRKVYSAGGVLPEAVAEGFRRKTGVGVGQVYGATEIGSVTYREGSGLGVGTLLPGVEARVVEGEVCVKSPWMMVGYLDEGTELLDGFWGTGDLGRVEGRDVVLEGRKKLMIETGGGKVNPLEVEAVLLEHPAVAECVVVAVAQTATSFRLRAVVVRRGEVTGEELRGWVRGKLAGFKVPRIVEFRESLPKSPAGKVLRGEV